MQEMTVRGAETMVEHEDLRVQMWHDELFNDFLALSSGDDSPLTLNTSNGNAPEFSSNPGIWRHDHEETDAGSLSTSPISVFTPESVPSPVNTRAASLYLHQSNAASASLSSPLSQHSLEPGLDSLVHCSSPRISLETPYASLNNEHLLGAWSPSVGHGNELPSAGWLADLPSHTDSYNYASRYMADFPTNMANAHGDESLTRQDSTQLHIPAGPTYPYCGFYNQLGLLEGIVGGTHQAQ
ncbi:hypothetical protein LTR16_005288 [Cryomyces antarcticus]|uniref:Uncharacterized protein n=1 Tax=Cryomyces antarcticus TaxID=329879 RepID=A0ABR0KR79_9PEZI|nr:hypothetical protein LTR16_005288 [Cryomyces antarcticus]